MKTIRLAVAIFAFVTVFMLSEDSSGFASSPAASFDSMDLSSRLSREVSREALAREDLPSSFLTVKKKHSRQKRSRRDSDELAGVPAAGGRRSAADLRASPADMLKIYDSIAGPENYTVDKSGIQAFFYRDGASWTIVGASAPVVNPAVLPKKWPVRGSGFEIVVLNEPVYNRQVLPFRVKLEGVRKTEDIYLSAAPDSFVPASFVIRSGDAGLEGLMVEASGLEPLDRKGGEAVPAENIDIRLVKCWYQAGIGLGDTRHKTLMPELLLHDNDLVRVDYENQVNLIKNLDRIEDAGALRPFSLPRRQNQQVWLTVHVKAGTAPGFYEGKIRVSGRRLKKELKLTLNVLPFTLPEPMLFYGLYYTGELDGADGPVISPARKSAEQMRADFADLKEHGITGIAIEHPAVGIQQIAESSGINEIYINTDSNPANPGNSPSAIAPNRVKNSPKSSHHLPSPISNLQASLSPKGFALGSLSDFLDSGSPAETWVISEAITDDVIGGIEEARGLKKTVYLSGSPPAGREEAELYRNNYGFKMFYAGANGVLAFAYQGDGGGSCWNDFRPGPTRPQVMAYPAREKPIPTLQWEGWREGVNDVRYLTLLYNKGIGEEELKGLISAFNDPENLREIIINKILRIKSGE